MSPRTKIVKREPVVTEVFFVGDRRSRPIEFAAYINDRQVWHTPHFRTQGEADDFLDRCLDSDTIGRVRVPRKDDEIIDRKQWGISSETLTISW